MALVDFFLKLKDIEGESKDSKHPKEIELESFSFGLSQTGLGHSGGGQGAGKASFQDIHLVSKMSKSSPKLALACATGQHIDQADLVCRKAGGNQEEYLKIKMTGVLVSSYNTGASTAGGVLPVDQFSLNYTKIEIAYQEQTEKGSVSSPVKVGYDIAANKKL